MRTALVTSCCVGVLALGCEDPTALTGSANDGDSGNNVGTDSTPGATSSRSPSAGPITGGILTGSASPSNPVGTPGATSSVQPGSSLPGSTVPATPTPVPTATPTPTPVDTRRSIDVLTLSVATPAIHVAPPAGRDLDALYPFRTTATVSLALLSDGSVYRGPFQYSVAPGGIVTVTPRLDLGADIRALSHGSDQIKEVVITVLASDSANLSNSRSATCSLRVLPVSGAHVTVK